MKRYLRMFWMAAGGLLLSAPFALATPDIYLLEVSGSINPGVVRYFQDGFEQAAAGEAACIIIRLDTPGGSVTAMRDIVKLMLATPVPVVVFVTPAGAQAASAGTMITMAADIAAMAPGTNIGAAHPVGMGGGEIDSTMADKVVNDMAASARSIAAKKGRNADWVEKAIRQSISATETEALKAGVIDLKAENLDDLIRQINGRTVKDKGELHLDKTQRIFIREGLGTRILKTISDPNIAWLLFLLGLAGIYFELANPGAIFPGVVGAIAMILAFYAFQTLPVNYAGILLILFSVVFFILEIKVTSYGMLSIAGVIALLFGTLMLYKNGAGTGISLAVMLPAVILIAGFFVTVASIAFKAQIAPLQSGQSAMIGEIGTARTSIAPEGKVLVHGEIWRARSALPIPQDARVRVVAVRNLMVDVEPCLGQKSRPRPPTSWDITLINAIKSGEKIDFYDDIINTSIIKRFIKADLRNFFMREMRKYHPGG